MIGMHMLQREYRAGQRVVAGRDHRHGLDGGRSYGQMRVEIVESIDAAAQEKGVNAAMVLRHGDETRTVMLCHTGVSDTAVERQPWQTVWTEPLPADDAAAIEMVAGALGTERAREAVLLWIGAVQEDGTAYAHQLVEEARDERNERLAIPTDGMAYVPLALKIATTCPLEARSLVVARLRSAHVKDGVVVHSIEGVRTVLTGVGLDEAAKAIPVLGSQDNHYGSSNFAGLYEISENEDRAHAMAEPSEALVLCWMDGDAQTVSVMGRTGIHFWRNDDPECYAEQSIPGPGLWMWTDVQGHAYTDHEGGHDYDMDGDWIPATEADLVRMIGSVEGADDEIREYTQVHEKDASARHIVLAVETDERVRVEDERRRKERRLAEDARLASKAA